MFRIKRLYTFVLETFLPLILATFSVCLFILLMQFLWKYVDDMVGKGVGLPVLAEMFFYAAMTLIPMALPLSILLASLMTFGNLGEHLELLAMKSSGISLIRIMKPLIFFVILMAGTAFVFQNNVLPPAQKKLYTILWSLKQKSPELDIPEKTFFKDIPKYNLYVREKTKDGLLKNLMIYDYSSGFDNAVVLVADSGRLKVSTDGESLQLTLYHGESFENLQTDKNKRQKDQIPYRRETFSLKVTIIPYDSNFNMADESIFQNRDATKNLVELRTFADSMTLKTDSASRVMLPSFRGQIYSNIFKQERSYGGSQYQDADTLYAHDFALFYENSTASEQIRYLENARSRTETLRNDYTIRERQQTDTLKQIRGHEIEFHKKFSLSLACILFFFIGAPLGAIIRKGGLGMPAVLSVVIFLLYYTLDTFAVKIAKSGVVSVWEGAWMSSGLLVALGAFFTYKAVNDSVMMNPDVWKEWLQRITGKRESRNYERKEVVMTPPDYSADLDRMHDWDIRSEQYLKKRKRFPFYISFWKRDFRDRELDSLVETMEAWIEDLRNSDQNLIIGKLMDYPVIRPFSLEKLNSNREKWICALLLPVGLSLYFVAMYKTAQLRQDLLAVRKVNEELRKELKKTV